MFLDEAIIDVHGGQGGHGCVSWRREKYEPKGGPDGGTGGYGGNVVLRANENTDTLSTFASQKVFEADNGQSGSGSNRAGRDGPDLVLDVPPGTSIVQLDAETGEPIGILADLQENGDSVIVAYGGKGGFGNSHFVSSIRQRPDFAEIGEPGEERKLKLELKLIADVGIIGFPSVGKSTLISVISNAKPKIAEYHFTTLVPNLGVVNAHDRSYIVCDVPGLIEGASEGKGLGDQFLRHIERTGVLLHVLDLSHTLIAGEKPDPQVLIQDYRVIRTELERYSPTLSEKKELVVLNKIDLFPDGIEEFEAALQKEGIDVFLAISAAATLNVQELKEKLLPIVLAEREKRENILMEDVEKARDELPVLKPQQESDKMNAYRIDQKQSGDVFITGRRLEQFTKMTNFSSRGGLDRFFYVIDRIGLRKALNKYRKDADPPIYIGDVRIDGYLDERQFISGR